MENATESQQPQERWVAVPALSSNDPDQTEVRSLREKVGFISLALTIVVAAKEERQANPAQKRKRQAREAGEAPVDHGRQGQELKDKPQSEVAEMQHVLASTGLNTATDLIVAGQERQCQRRSHS